jgi:hypothetical protein
MILEQDPQWTYCQCDKCGVKYTISSRRLTRADYCNSCNAKPAARVIYDGDYCKPWHGDFDEWENPIQDGRLFKAGIRTCGHRDCVRDLHIVKIKPEPKQRAVDADLLAEIRQIVESHQGKKMQHHGITICQLTACESPFLSKGLCSIHYATWRRYREK